MVISFELTQLEIQNKSQKREVMNSYENERDFRLKLDNKKLSIDEKYFGFIVGKNGSIAKGIQATTGTQIQFLNNSGKISNWCRQLAR